jgi:LPXTG-motif cell wall-anchored protein
MRRFVVAALAAGLLLLSAWKDLNGDGTHYTLHNVAANAPRIRQISGKEIDGQTTPTTVPVEQAALANTGTDPVWPLVSGLLLLAGGIGVVFLARRRP